MQLEGPSVPVGKNLEKPEKLVWIYCKALKFHKTAKTFLGNPWRRNHTSLEMFGVRTEFVWRRLARGLVPRARLGWPTSSQRTTPATRRRRDRLAGSKASSVGRTANLRLRLQLAIPIEIIHPARVEV